MQNRIFTVQFNQYSTNGNDCRKKSTLYFADRTAASIFALRYANKETYQTHKETFLREVCSVCMLPYKSLTGLPELEGFFYAPIPAYRQAGPKGEQGK